MDGSEPEPGSRLLAGERLVRDGVAKLYLCWIAWTLAQHHQCVKLENRRIGDTARRLLERIELTSGTRGTPPNEADKVEAHAYNGESGDRGIISMASFRWLTGVLKAWDCGDLTEIARRLSDAFASVNTSPDLALASMLSERIRLVPWARRNGLNVADVRWLIRRARLEEWKRASQPAGLNWFRRGRPIARAFWGAASSVERTTRAEYEAGRSLAEFQSFAPGDDSERASPLPLDLLVRWGAILGFGPWPPDAFNEDETSRHRLPEKDRTVWKSFGAQPDGATLAGGALLDFAAALNDHLKSASPSDMKWREKRKFPVISQPKAPAPAKPQSKPAPPPIQASRVTLAPITHRGDDDLRLRIRTTPEGRVALDEIQYQFTNDDADGEDLRVCLAWLRVVWTWEDPAGVVFAAGDGISALETALRDANAQLEFKVGSENGKLTMQMRRRESGAAFPPISEVAIASLTLPAARLHMMAGEATHSFSVSARVQDIRIARKDPATGAFMLASSAGERLRRPDETLEHAAASLWTQAVQSFREEGWRELGARKASTREIAEATP